METQQPRRLLRFLYVCVTIKLETMKRVVIMGATSGIGLNLAEKLALEGMQLGVAGRKTEVLRELQQKYPSQIHYATIDITAADAADKLQGLIGRMGGMDVYVHVAGIGFDSDPLEPAKEIATMQTNVVGFTRMIDAAYLYFREHHGGHGHIAAVTSVAGTNGIGRLAAYSASKRFQQTYLRALNQLANINGLKIKFTDIRPGWIRTPLLDPDRNYPMIMQLPYAVGKIASAIERKARVAVVDWRWNIVVGLWRLIPNALWVRLAIPVDSVATPVQRELNALEKMDGELRE